jgi:hypothetical protein
MRISCNAYEKIEFAPLGYLPHLNGKTVGHIVRAAIRAQCVAIHVLQTGGAK